ncbi:hypothetical protein NQD34_013438 [Periophthalmus magnuspinnatus]|nr:hypothetical protein NQD34_013438 [Periophthalmus magnuspinnatus]
MLLVPVFLCVLYLGYRKWKKHPRSSVSHSDVFTFHMVGEEMLTALGSTLFAYGLFAKVTIAFSFGMSLVNLAGNGQLYFHSLTCAERYLAVVHPVTYLRLKKGGGVTIRNICVGFVWALSTCHSLTILHSFWLENMIQLWLVMLSLALMFFCSVSVLCVLIRPGPGEGRRTRKNQSKQSSFYTIMAILAALAGRFVNVMVLQSLSLFMTLNSCFVMASTLWLSFPSSLVLPLLFLHRATPRQSKN